MNKALKIYAPYFMRQSNIIEELIQKFASQGKKMAIWGAGLKGEAFLKIFDSDNKKIQFVFDIDNKKEGKKTKSGHTIVNYRDEENKGINIIFLMNSVYENEVAYLIRQAGIEACLINLDSMIEGELTTKEIIEFYFKS